MPDPGTAGTTESVPGASEETSSRPQRDLEMLAERILQLLKEEARLERERLGAHRGG